jgi:alpha-mannosidase
MDKRVFLGQHPHGFTPFWYDITPYLILDDKTEPIDREALIHNEKPFALSLFPSGDGILPLPSVLLEDKVIQMTAFKKSENSDDLIIRLFEPTGEARSTTLNIPFLGVKQEIRFEKFEIKSLRLDIKDKTLKEVDLMEQDKIN